MKDNEGRTKWSGWTADIGIPPIQPAEVHITMSRNSKSYRIEIDDDCIIVYDKENENGRRYYHLPAPFINLFPESILYNKEITKIEHKAYKHLSKLQIAIMQRTNLIEEYDVEVDDEQT